MSVIVDADIVTRHHERTFEHDATIIGEGKWNARDESAFLGYCMFGHTENKYTYP